MSASTACSLNRRNIRLQKRGILKDFRTAVFFFPVSLQGITRLTFAFHISNQGSPESLIIKGQLSELLF